jgi:integrase
MGSIRARKDTGALFFDFIYKGMRCRELTTLRDSSENRRAMEKMLKKIEAEIVLEQFDYARYFPTSPVLKKISATEAGLLHAGAGEGGKKLNTPRFKDFSEEWFDENAVRWKRSYREMIRGVMDKYLHPGFGETKVSRVTKGDILKFRSALAKLMKGSSKKLSPDRINHIMTPLRMILNEAAERFDFITPYIGIRQLRVPKSDVDPFAIEEVNLFIANVRPDFRNYYTVRFFTGMRTSEIDGLKWKYVDFERRQIHIRESLVKGYQETTKTQQSFRTIDMSQIIGRALQEQYRMTAHLSEYVFCTRDGSPLQYSNVANRVWYPTLGVLKMKKRRPYQTRHTTATLWLAAGENPEWIAGQMGHANTKMLFTVYSRFVPNITRQDGSAFDRLLSEHVHMEG